MLYTGVQYKKLPPVQSVPFTTKVESLNPDNAGVYSIRHYICQGLAAGQLFFPVSSSNKTGHDLQTKSMNLHDMNFQNKQTKRLSVQVFI
jgi:hypothetical protein